jgi:transposase
MLLGISKRGDRYLRTLQAHGARLVIVRVLKRDDEKGGWLKRLLERRHVNIATVALAHKTVRTVWAMRGPRPRVLSVACSGMKTRN